MHRDCARIFAETHPDAQISDSCCICAGPFRVERVEDDGTAWIGGGGVATIEWESDGEIRSADAHLDCAERHPMNIKNLEGTQP